MATNASKKAPGHHKNHNKPKAVPQFKATPEKTFVVVAMNWVDGSELRMVDNTLVRVPFPVLEVAFG